MAAEAKVKAKAIFPPKKALAKQVPTQSLEEDNTHTPMITLECNAMVVPGTKFGQWNLYLDTKTTWVKYKALLTKLRDIGVITKEYYNTAVAQKYTEVSGPEKVDPNQKGAAILIQNSALGHHAYKMEKALSVALDALRAANAGTVADAIEAEYVGQGN